MLTFLSFKLGNSPMHLPTQLKENCRMHYRTGELQLKLNKLFMRQTRMNTRKFIALFMLNVLQLPSMCSRYFHRCM